MINIFTLTNINTKITQVNKKYFFIKRECDVTFLDKFWVLILNLAFIFLWHVKFWSYSERLSWVSKQFYANIFAFFFQVKNDLIIQSP